MKIDVRDNNLIVFLSNNFVENVDFNECELEKYFRSLFFKLGDFGLDFSGSYTIDVYIDEKCGILLDIVNDDVDYYDCDIVDMNISISKYKGFLFQVDNFIDINCSIIVHNGCFYYDLSSINCVDIGRLFENCDIVYGKDAYDIRCYGRVIDNSFQNMYNC